MADPVLKKITELSQISTVAAGDVLPIVDISEANSSLKNKKVRMDQLKLYSADQITDGIIGSVKLASGAAIGNLGIGSIVAEKIAQNAVITEKIANLAVTAAKLAEGAALANLMDKSIPTTKLADKAVTSAKLNDSAVTTIKLNDSSIITTKIADNAITEDKLGNSAVTEGKIANNAVTGGKIASRTITATKIAEKAITGIEIADHAIQEAQLRTYVGSEAVTTATIRNNAVTEAKLGSIKRTVTIRITGIEDEVEVVNYGNFFPWPVSLNGFQIIDARINLTKASTSGSVTVAVTNGGGVMSTLTLGSGQTGMSATGSITSGRQNAVTNSFVAINVTAKGTGAMGLSLTFVLQGVPS